MNWTRGLLGFSQVRRRSGPRGLPLPGTEGDLKKQKAKTDPCGAAARHLSGVLTGREDIVWVAGSERFGEEVITAYCPEMHPRMVGGWPSRFRAAASCRGLSESMSEAVGDGSMRAGAARSPVVNVARTARRSEASRGSAV